MVRLFIEQCEEDIIDKSQIPSSVPPIKPIRPSKMDPPFIEQCDEDIIDKSHIPSSVPPIKPVRTSNNGKPIRRTVTFNVGAPEDLSRIDSAAEIKQSESLGAASASFRRRADVVKIPAQTQTAITYASWLMKDSSAAQKNQVNSLAERSSPPSVKKEESGERIDNCDRQSVRSVRRRNSAPELKKHTAVLRQTKTIDSDSQLPFYLSETSSGGIKIMINSNRMNDKNHQENSLEILPEMPQENISGYNDEMHGNQETTQKDIGNQNGQTTRKDFFISQLVTANHRQIVSSESEENANDTTGITEISTDSAAAGGSWGYRRKKVSKIPTFVRRQEAWQRRIERYLKNSLGPAQNMQNYSDDSSSDSDTTAESLIGRNHSNSNNPESSTDSTGYSSLSPKTVYPYNWRPPPPSELLHCECERCSSVMVVCERKELCGCGHLVRNAHHLTRPYNGSTFSPSEIHLTNSEVNPCSFIKR